MQSSRAGVKILLLCSQACRKAVFDYEYLLSALRHRALLKIIIHIEVFVSEFLLFSTIQYIYKAYFHFFFDCRKVASMRRTQHRDTPLSVILSSLDGSVLVATDFPQQRSIYSFLSENFGFARCLIIGRGDFNNWLELLFLKVIPDDVVWLFLSDDNVLCNRLFYFQFICDIQKNR